MATFVTGQVSMRLVPDSGRLPRRLAGRQVIYQPRPGALTGEVGGCGLVGPHFCQLTGGSPLEAQEMSAHPHRRHGTHHKPDAHPPSPLVRQPPGTLAYNANEEAAMPTRNVVLTNQQHEFVETLVKSGATRMRARSSVRVFASSNGASTKTKPGLQRFGLRWIWGGPTSSPAATTRSK